MSGRRKTLDSQKRRQSKHIPDDTSSQDPSDQNKMRDEKVSSYGWRQHVSGFWITHEIAQTSDNDVQIQTTLQELIFYAIFLTAFTFVAFGQSSITQYYMTRVTNTLLLTTSGDGVAFNEITTMADFWKYLEGPFINALYWNTWYGPEENVSFVRFMDDDEMNSNVLFQNKLLGVARLRQVKVRKDSCKVEDDFKNMFKTCYDYFSPQAEDTESFGLKKGSPWTHSSPNELGTQTYSGLIGSYTGGGYYQDFTKDREESVKIIQDLKQNLWIDRGTRAVFVDFTLYNVNVNLFSVIKLVAEFPPSGGVLVSSSFRTIDLIRYSNAFDYFILSNELIVLLFIIYYSLEEIREIFHFKLQYMTKTWNLMDITIISMSYTYLGFSIYRYTTIHHKLDYLLDHEEEYPDFDTISSMHVIYENLEACALFFAWVKVFKFIGFNKTMSQLSSTLSRCAWDIAGFSVMFFIVFCAFAQLAHLLFGSQIERFNTFVSSMFSLIRIILADFNYEEIETASSILGPIFFITYIFFVFFVLLNMFLAIINDTYSEVKSELSTEKKLEAVDFLKRGFTNISRRCGFAKAIKRKKQEPTGTYNDIKETLRKSNFDDVEIDMFFAKYNIDENKVIDKDEIDRMLKDLESSWFKTDLVPRSSLVTQEELKMVEERVQRMEDSVIEAINKADMILEALEKLEHKSRRR